MEEAEKTIKELNGVKLLGSTVRMSLAKYEKGGRPINVKKSLNKASMDQRRRTWLPAYRDTRRYVEVVTGKRDIVDETQENDKGDQPTTSPERQHIGEPVEQMENSIPAQVSLKLPVNPTVVEKLSKAVVLEYEETLSLKHAAARIIESNVPFDCISFMSPFFLILLFESELELQNAIDVNSPLWKYFKNIRRYSENDCYNERLTWIEFHGLHPKCWSLENI